MEFGLNLLSRKHGSAVLLKALITSSAGLTENANPKMMALIIDFKHGKLYLHVCCINGVKLT